MRGAVLFVTLLVVAGFWISRQERTHPVVGGEKQQAQAGENSPICPWREPERDLKTLFPQATQYTIETRILSAFMTPIHQRLKRSMTVDENPLRIYRAVDGTQVKGAILVKRVKGEHGGIELVIGIDTDGRLRGVLIQSQREPQAVSQAVTEWLPSFAGRTAESPLQPGEDLPTVAAEARATANSIAEGVRSGLIVLSFAENQKSP